MKNLLLFLIAYIALCWPLLATAQAPDRNYVNTLEGCQIHIWPSTPKTKVSWSGACNADRTSGLGTMVWYEGNERKIFTYQGYMADGKFNGEGILFNESNRVVEQGNWVNDRLRNAYVVNLPSLEATKEETTLARQMQMQKENEQKRLFEEIRMKEQQRLALEASENSRLRAEAEESKRKQVDLENQLRLAQQPVIQQSTPVKISQGESKRTALVIGNANYRSLPLKNPLNDASDISAVLKQSGFEVLDLRNATLQEMTKGVREFGDRLLKSDVGLVYFSGHGIEVNGRNYLMPVNASMDREDEVAFQALDANLILEKMNTAKKSVNILIVDACRDNPFARSFRSTSKGLAQMDAPSGTIVSFSTSPGKIAADGEGRNSPFTKNLVKAMTRPNVPIESVFKEVRKSVVEETKGRQTPWESSSLIGDFYFKVSK